MKQRACETVLLKSKHERFGKVGSEKWATPDEAQLMVSLGMAVRVEEEPVQNKEYLHREMRATGSRKVRGA
jgi:hypothetical protein